jgi:hypothetical protein
VGTVCWADIDLTAWELGLAGGVFALVDEEMNRQRQTTETIIQKASERMTPLLSSW